MTGVQTCALPIFNRVNIFFDTIKSYKDLETITGLFEQVQLDESRTCVFWNDYIDLPSDTIYENAQTKTDKAKINF